MWPHKSRNTTTFASLLTSVIRQPLVEFPLEDGAVELGALLLTEILGSLRTVLMETKGGSREVRRQLTRITEETLI